MQQLAVCASQLLILSAMNNAKNQRVLFDKLNLFRSRDIRGVNSAKIMRTVLQGNLLLSQIVPRELVVEIFDKILTEGQKPEYLEILCSLAGANDTAQLDNQFEVMKPLTDSKREQKIMALPAKPGSYP